MYFSQNLNRICTYNNILGVETIRIFSKDWFRTNPLKALLLVLIVVVASVAVVHAYWRLLPPQAGPRVSITSPPLEFSLEMDKTEFQQSENVTIRLSLKNMGNKTITLSWPNFLMSNFYLYGDRIMYFDFYVADANNTRVFQYTKEFGAAQSVLEETLNPGEQLVSVCVWYQKTGHSDYYAQVPKGSYSVRGSTRRVRLIVDDQTSVITLEAPTIAFTIT